MKQCPISKDLDCEDCKMNFGHDKCGIFSIAADMSYQTELLSHLLTFSQVDLRVLKTRAFHLTGLPEVADRKNSASPKGIVS